MPSQEQPENEFFDVWHDSADSVDLFCRYLKNQWLFSMDGIQGLNVQTAIEVIKLNVTGRTNQSQTLDDVLAFADGVLTKKFEGNK